MGRVNPGRLAALRVLVAVEEGAHAEDLLPEVAPAHGSDRALAWHLTLGTLRFRGRIDKAIRPFLKRPLDDLDSAVRNALRLGVFESSSSRTPDHAAVSQAVEACRAIGLGRATGMVNAVLRKAVKQELSSDPFDDLPDWLRSRWKAYPDWVASMKEPSSVCMVSDSQPTEGAEPAVLGSEIIPDLWSLPPGSGAITALEVFQRGDAWVMDASAAKVADLTAQSINGRGTVLDACAAPGGKTFRMVSAGLDVTAVEVSEMRIARMNDNLDRLSMNVDIVQHDWLRGPMSNEPVQYDAVLVDAPCTGLGTVRRHPEILWRRHPADPLAMAIRQRQILQSASVHVKPGGALIYAVCSPEPEEGLQVVQTLSGWKVDHSWSSVPPARDEDAFQAFILRREET